MFLVIYIFLLQDIMHIKAPPQKLLCCPLPTDRKMRKNRAVFFYLFFFMSDLGEEFAKICIQWLKKALVYAFWLHSARVFPI